MIWKYSVQIRENTDSNNSEYGHFLSSVSWIIIDNQLKRVKSKRRELPKPKERGSRAIGIPFNVTYYPHLKRLRKLIQNNIKHRYADAKVRSVFT